MKLKKYAFGIISGLALSGLLATTALADTVRLKLAGTYPVNHFGHGIVENMIKEIEDADVGVKISFFGASYSLSDINRNSLILRKVWVQKQLQHHD